MNIKEAMRKYALQNAVKFEGKASAGAVIGKTISENPDLKSKIDEIKKQVQSILKEVNAMKLEDQKKELQKIAPELLKEEKKEKKTGLKELKDAKHGKVVMRLAPSPSGALHLGHAYVLSLNSELCRKYNGKLIIRIEDTNPENIYEPAYNLIEQDAKWLTKDNVHSVVIQSDRLGIYYDYAEKLIGMEKAYVCTCNSDVFRELIFRKTPCPCRDLPKKEHLKRWNKMFGEYKPGEAVVRIKTDINHKNPAMRDWPALRINDHVHPRTGTEHKVWPLMNFSVAIDDMELGITHTIRGKDHMDNEKRQKFIFDFLKKKPPVHLYIGRINFKDMQLSSTETKKLIEYGEYDGWDDIRLPFLPAMKRRGYQPEAFIKYSMDVGITQNDKTVTKQEFFKALDFFNKSAIDERSNRYFFIHDPVKVSIENSKPTKIKLNLHPDYPKRGTRDFEISDKFYMAKEDFDGLKSNKLYRLMDCLNFKKQKDKLVFDSTEYAKFREKGEKIFHWLPVQKDLIKIEVKMPDGSIKTGLGEKSLDKLKHGEIVQLERFGFVRLDNKTKTKLVFWFTHK